MTEDYTKVKVGELREKLVSFGYSQEEADSIKGKANLIAEVEKMSQLPEISGILPEEAEEEDDLESVLEGLDDDDIEDVLQSVGSDVGGDVDLSSFLIEEEMSEKEEPVQHKVESVEGPSYFSNEYKTLSHEEIMASLDDSEIAEGKYPTTHGLRRLSQQIFGKIIASGPVNVFPDKDAEGRPMSTVVYQIVFSDGTTISDIAECWYGNTPNIYAVHPSATASTKAEGRALRKLLGVHICTAEEMDNDKNPDEVLSTGSVRKLMEEMESYGDENSLISATQMSFINSKCSALGIDPMKFINKKYCLGKEEEPAYTSMNLVPYKIAVAMIQELNAYQGDHDKAKDIPEELKVEK